MGPWHLSFFTFFMFLHYHLGSGRLLKSRSWTWAEALHNMRSQYGILCYARLFEILQRSRAYLFSTIAASLHIALESSDMKPIRYAPDYREYAVSLRNVYCTLLRWMLFLHIPQRKDGRPNNRKQQTKPEGEGVNSFFFFLLKVSLFNLLAFIVIKRPTEKTLQSTARRWSHVLSGSKGIILES